MKPQEFSKWCNAIAEAYNLGIAPWAYPNGRSEAVRVWNEVRSEQGPDAADAALVEWAMAHGIRLRKGKLWIRRRTTIGEKMFCVNCFAEDDNPHESAWVESEFGILCVECAMELAPLGETSGLAAVAEALQIQKKSPAIKPL